jgi:tight adherence protein B
MKRFWISVVLVVAALGSPAFGATSTYPDVVLAFDVSQSMQGDRIAAAKTATSAFVGGLPSEVRVGLLTFSSNVRMVVSPTRDRGTLINAITGLKASGDTSLYDAVSKAAAALKYSPSARIVVLSDGEDNDSTASLSQLIRQLTNANITVDAVALSPTKQQLNTLRQIVQLNHGVLVAAAGADKLLAAFEQVVVVTPTPTTQSPKPTHGTTASPTSSTSVGDLDQSLAGRLGAFVTAALLFWLLITIYTAWRYRRMSKFRKRLVQYTEGVVPLHADDTAPEQTSLLDSWRLEVRLPKTAKRLEDSSLGIPLNIWVLMMTTLWFIVMAVFKSSTSSTLIGFIVASLVVTQTGRVFLSWRFNRRLREFEDDLPATLAVLASSLRAGLSFAQAIDTAIADGKGEIALQFRQALQEVQVGSSLEDALMRAAERMKSEDLKWAVTGLAIQREVGGSLSRILDTSAKTIRERAELRREVRTLSAEGRLSAVVLAGLPILIFLFLLITRPSYVSVFWSEPIGNIMMIAMALLFMGGWFWVNKLVTVRV